MRRYKSDKPTYLILVGKGKDRTRAQLTDGWKSKRKDVQTYTTGEPVRARCVEADGWMDERMNESVKM
jgi:hypothetical protein